MKAWLRDNSAWLVLCGVAGITGAAIGLAVAHKLGATRVENRVQV